MTLTLRITGTPTRAEVARALWDAAYDLLENKVAPEYAIDRDGAQVGTVIIEEKP